MQSNEQNFVPALGADWATKFYDPLVRLTTREYTFKRALISQAQLKGDEKILDLACGTGTLSLGIKRRFPLTELCGIDADPEVLEKAQLKAKERDLEISFEKSFSYDLPFESNTFDAIFSTLFFHHLTLQQKIETFKEILRVLKPEGKLHIADYGKPKNWLQNSLSTIIKLIDGNETTKDNLAGRLKIIAKEGGFAEVQETMQFQTMLGTICLLSANNL